MRVATWQRDRLGYLQPFDQRQLQVPGGCHVISAPIDLGSRPAQLFLNVDGLSEHAQVTVEILDERFRPVSGYSHRECLPLESGLKQPVAWDNRELVEAAGGSIRIRVNYTGIRPEDPRLYAIYVDPAGLYAEGGVAVLEGPPRGR